MKKWERESLTSEEVDLVIAAARNEEETAMMTVLADTGMRDVYLHIDEKETARKLEESGWLER